ncbi:unnamed protein product, partial [Protopolystoma xenopodis]
MLVWGIFVFACGFEYLFKLMSSILLLRSRQTRRQTASFASSRPIPQSAQAVAEHDAYREHYRYLCGKGLNQTHPPSQGAQTCYQASNYLSHHCHHHHQVHKPQPPQLRGEAREFQPSHSCGHNSFGDIHQHLHPPHQANPTQHSHKRGESLHAKKTQQQNHQYDGQRRHNQQHRTHQSRQYVSSAYLDPSQQNGFLPGSTGDGPSAGQDDLPSGSEAKEEDGVRSHLVSSTRYQTSLKLPIPPPSRQPTPSSKRLRATTKTMVMVSTTDSRRRPPIRRLFLRDPDSQLQRSSLRKIPSSNHLIPVSLTRVREDEYQPHGELSARAHRHHHCHHRQKHYYHQLQQHHPSQNHQENRKQNASTAVSVGLRGSMGKNHALTTGRKDDKALKVLRFLTGWRANTGPSVAVSSHENTSSSDKPLKHSLTACKCLLCPQCPPSRQSGSERRERKTLGFQ